MKELNGIVIQKKMIRDQLCLVKVFSESNGLQGFWWKGSSKTGPKFNLFDVIQFQIKEDQKDHTPWLRNPQVTQHLFHSRIDPTKSATLLFFQEVLHHLLEEHYQNPPLYHFLVQLTLDLDSADQVQSYHFAFAVGLMRALGCCPIVPKDNPEWFSMKEGQFGKGYVPPGLNITKDQNQLALFIDILQHNWDFAENKNVTGAQKRSLLRDAIEYLFIQMEKKSTIQSLEIFYELFHL